MNYDQIFDEAIDRLHTEGRYRVFIDIMRNKGSFPNARCFHGHNGPRPITVWCSNDYLAMGQHPKVVEEIESALPEVMEGFNNAERVKKVKILGEEWLPDTDLLTPTAGLRLPVLAIAGDHDGSTPPDLMREMADAIPGSRFHLIRGAGHLPPIEAPDVFAAALREFIEATGHLRPA